MKEKDAKKIADLLAKVSSNNGQRFQKIEYIADEYLLDFHQWADDKPSVGAFLFENSSGKRLWFLMIAWGKDISNFYVVIFPESKKGPIAEIHKHSTLRHNEDILTWRYSPTKQDGKNEARKTYFEEAFLSCQVKVSIPTKPEEIDDFIEELFLLANSRDKAHNLDPNKPAQRRSFPEGALKKRLHLARERNQELVRQAKQAAMDQAGHLVCSCCGFDFCITYGDVGKGFIEAHHTKPISEIHEDGEETKIEDLALVCANCHRMLHRKRPWLKLGDLSQLLK